MSCNHHFVIFYFESRSSVLLLFITNYFIIKLVVVTGSETYIFRRQGGIKLGNRVEASLVAMMAASTQ